MNQLPPLPQAVGWLGLFGPGGERSAVYTTAQMIAYGEASQASVLTPAQAQRIIAALDPEDAGAGEVAVFVRALTSPELPQESEKS